MEVPAPYELTGGSVPEIVVHALKENKRPIGFAPWPEDEPKPKPKRKPRAKPQAKS